MVTSRLESTLMSRHSARVHPNPRSTTAPEVLLAEDDPASSKVLEALLARLGCHVTSCADGTGALSAARTRLFDFLLIDRHLPGLDAVAIMTALRHDPQARSKDVPAVASSAEWDAASMHRMLDAGFAGTLAKPCNASQLQILLHTHVPHGAWPVRNDSAALDAAGSAANLAALRRLFAVELVQLQQELPTLAATPPALVDRLHRLYSSAGFCGAPALAVACSRCLHQLRTGHWSTCDHNDLVEVLEATLASLESAD